MRAEYGEARVITISDAPKLDPIFVVMHNLGFGKGRLVVSCWDQSWTAYWGATGQDQLIDFLVACNTSYVAGKLKPPKCSKREEEYLNRITETVLHVLRSKTMEEP